MPKRRPLEGRPGLAPGASPSTRTWQAFNWNAILGTQNEPALAGGDFGLPGQEIILYPKLWAGGLEHFPVRDGTQGFRARALKQASHWLSHLGFRRCLRKAVKLPPPLSLLPRRNGRAFSIVKSAPHL